MTSSDLIKSPRVIEFEMIRKIMSDEAQKMGIEILQSDYKNLIRKISNRFEKLKFVQKSPNNVLVYRSTIKIVQKTMISSQNLTFSTNLKSDNETAVINVADIKCYIVK